ncbi:MAG: DegT/DnrJ/EryC1/StrS family aminotransferase [Nitrospirae bacterium]|nr:DegT/DnrJ/EryC1/StrS family aminotransferase [Nitrospirota bacterium]
MKKIPLIDLKAGFEPIKDEVMKAIESVFSTMNLYIGPNVQALEEEFASYCKTKYAIAVGSGTDAIHLALLSARIRRGDEVIVSPNTFFATVEAIAYIGAMPVFVDIDPVTYTIDTFLIEKKINSKTKAVVPVHMYGQSANIKPIMELSEKYGIKIIEDACQAHGAEYHNKKCGSIGDAGCFSFYFTKNLGGYGEGGMVVTNNHDIAEKVRLFRNHGHKSKYEHSVMGYNNRLDELQAAILRIKLKHLDNYNENRRSIAKKYNALFGSTPLILPKETADRKHVYHLYVVRTPQRDELQEYLNERGISTGIHYKVPIHLQEACRVYGYKYGDFPETEKACKEILSLPIYPELKDNDIRYIVDAIKEFYSKK